MFYLCFIWRVGSYSTVKMNNDLSCVCLFVAVSEASAAGAEAIPEICVSTDEGAQVDKSPSDPNDISLGNVSIES